MHWLFMIAAICFEVVGTVSLKLSMGFTTPLFVVVTVVGYMASLGLLGLALKGIPVSAAYAVWSGLGTALVAVVGMAALGEPASALRFACIALIITGVVGLYLVDRAV